MNSRKICLFHKLDTHLPYFYSISQFGHPVHEKNNIQFIYVYPSVVDQLLVHQKDKT